MRDEGQKAEYVCTFIIVAQAVSACACEFKHWKNHQMVYPPI